MLISSSFSYLLKSLLAICILHFSFSYLEVYYSTAVQKLGRRGPSTHPAPLEAMKPGQRPQAGSGCPGCAVACRAGLQGLQEHEGEDISPSATPSCCKTVWLQLTNPPKLIRALQMCRHPGQPRCQPVPSREEGCTRLSSTLSPGAANPGCGSPSRALHPEAPPMLHGARETHSGT